MSEELKHIKDIMKYLNRVSNASEIGLINQDFFLDDTQLRILIQNYYVEFNNSKELMADLRFKYEHLKNLSFEKGNFLRVKDLSNNVRVMYSQKEHQAYAFKVHKFFIDELERKLNIKTKKQTNKLSIKNKQVYELFKLIDLKLDIFKSGEEFIDSSVKEKNLEFYLNIDNRSFHYILTILKPYFYHFELQKFVTANKIYTLRGTILTKKNLHNSKSDYSRYQELIDEILNNFKK